MKRIEFNKNVLLIFIVVITSFYLNLGIAEPDIMEARNFITAKEMVDENKWLIPTMNGELRLEKPPLPTWLTAINMKIFNRTTHLFFMRLPVAIIASLMIFFLYNLVLNLSDHRFKNQLAILSALVLPTTFKVMQIGMRNSWDLYNYAFMLGAINYLVIGLKKRRKKYFIFSALFIALSVMSKGPVGIYGMLVPFLISYYYIYIRGNISWCKKGNRELKTNVFSLILLSTFLSFLWYLIVYIVEPGAFSSVAAKEINTWGNKHTQPFWFYLQFIAYSGVWMVFGISSFFPRYVEKRIEDLKLYRFSLIWLGLTYLFLSLVPMKKERYALPIYICFAILIAQILHALLAMKNYEKSDRFIIKIHSALMGVLAFGLAGYLNLQKNLNDYKHINLIIFLFISLGVLFIYNLSKKEEMQMKKIMKLNIIYILFIYMCVYPFGENITSGKDKQNYNFEEIYKNYDIDEGEYIYSIEKYRIQDVWYFQRKIKIFETEKISDLDYPIIIVGKEEKIINKYFHDSKFNKQKIEILNKKNELAMNMYIIEDLFRKNSYRVK